MKKKLLSIFLVATTVFMLVGCGNNKQTENVTSETKEERVLRIGFPSAGSGFTGDLLGIAQEKGFLEDELKKTNAKVEFTPFTGAGPAINEALVSKSLDIATYADFPGIVLKSKGIDIPLIAINNQAYASRIVVKKDSPINSIKDLQGQKIGFIKGTVYQKLFLSALKDSGLTTNDVEIVNFSSTADSQTALLSGNVVAIADMYTNSKMTSEARVLVDSLDNLEWGGLWITVGRADYIKQNSDIINAYVKSLVRAKEFIKNNSDEAYSIWTREGYSKDAIKTIYGNIDNFPIEITDKSIELLNGSKRFLLDENLIQKDFELEKWVDKDIYKNAIGK